MSERLTAEELAEYEKKLLWLAAFSRTTHRECIERDRAFSGHIAWQDGEIARLKAVVEAARAAIGRDGFRGGTSDALRDALAALDDVEVEPTKRGNQARARSALGQELDAYQEQKWAEYHKQRR